MASPGGLKLQGVNLTGLGNRTLAGEVAGKQIRLYKCALFFSAAGSVQFLDGTTGMTAAIPVAANGSITWDLDGEPWLPPTTAGNALKISIPAGMSVTGNVWYTIG